LSFRASEARHGIQYFQHVLDTGLRRYDDGDGFFTITTQSPAVDKQGCASRFSLKCFFAPADVQGQYRQTGEGRYPEHNELTAHS